LLVICNRDKPFTNQSPFHLEGIVRNNIVHYSDCCKPITKTEAAIEKMKER